MPAGEVEALAKQPAKVTEEISSKIAAELQALVEGESKDTATAPWVRGGDGASSHPLESYAPFERDLVGTTNANGHQ